MNEVNKTEALRYNQSEEHIRTLFSTIAHLEQRVSSLENGTKQRVSTILELFLLKGEYWFFLTLARISLKGAYLGDIHNIQVGPNNTHQENTTLHNHFRTFTFARLVWSCGQWLPGIYVYCKLLLGSCLLLQCSLMRHSEEWCCPLGKHFTAVPRVIRIQSRFKK